LDEPISLDYGNCVLYRMCQEEPSHQDPRVVAGKIWLIGRAYAAPIERGSGQTGKSNDLYRKVAEAMRPDFDLWLSDISDIKSAGINNIYRILTVYRLFIDLLRTHTGRERRSFASKYLHFHMPGAFFIYDSRADVEIRSRSGDRVHIPPECRQADPVYAAFSVRCIRYRDSSATRRQMTPRELDRELLGY